MGYAPAVGCGTHLLNSSHTNPMRCSAVFRQVPGGAQAFRRPFDIWFFTASWLFCSIVFSAAAAAQGPVRPGGAQGRASAKSSPSAPKHKLPAGSPFDRVQTKDGTVMVGLVLGSNAEWGYVACRRSWLREHDPKYDERARQLRALEQHAYEQMRGRLERLIAEDREPACRFVWEQELERATKWLQSETHEESELVLFEIPRGEIANVDRLAGTTASLAIWAWDQRLESPEGMAGEAIAAELKTLGVDASREVPDLGRRFQAMPQSEDEWLARCALVRYSRSQAIDFQGSGGAMFRIEKGKPVDVNQLLSKSLESQSQSLLKELLGEKPSRAASGGMRPWIQSSASQLQNPKEDYFRATQAETDLVGGETTVTSVFVVRNRLGDWTPIWRVEKSVARGQVTRDGLKEIESDPQIQSLMSLLKPLGIANDETLQMAMVMGAATKQAQEEANSKFETFRQRYQHRMDLPVLRWENMR